MQKKDYLVQPTLFKKRQDQCKQSVSKISEETFSSQPYSTQDLTKTP